HEHDAPRTRPGRAPARRVRRQGRREGRGLVRRVVREGRRRALSARGPVQDRAGARRSMSALRFLAMAIVLLLGGCSDAFLYGVGREDPSPARLGLSGRVCTDDAAEAGFPVKVIFLADVANGPLFAWDSEQVRLQA